MADVVSLTIDVDSRRVGKANDDLDRLGFTARKTGSKIDGFQNKTKQATKETNRMSSAANKLRGMIGLLSAGIAGIGIVQLASQIERATTQMNNMNATMRVATGSAQAAGQQIAFIREESERLGLFFPSVAKQMAQFSAAARTSSITGEELRTIFTGIAEASRAMGLTAPQTEGAMMALQQMMSKGKVSAEELRQQLGERMPGSIQIMASALDVTTEKLFDMMENGELLSDEVLPKFGRELQKVFGGEAASQANKIAASIQRLRNSIFDLMAQDNLTGAADAIDRLAVAVGSPEFQRGFDYLVGAVSNFLGVIAENLDHLIEFSKLLIALGAGRGAAMLTMRLGALSASLTSMTGKIVATNRATVALIGSMTTLSTLISRIAWPIAAITAVGSAIYMFSKRTKDSTVEARDLNSEIETLGKGMMDLTQANLRYQRSLAAEDFTRYIEKSKELADLQRRLQEARESSGDRGFISFVDRDNTTASLKEQIRQLELERSALEENTSYYAELTRRLEDHKNALEDATTEQEAFNEALDILAKNDDLVSAQLELKTGLEELRFAQEALGLSDTWYSEEAQKLINDFKEEVYGVSDALEAGRERAEDFISGMSQRDMMPIGQRNILDTVEGVGDELEGIGQSKSLVNTNRYLEQAKEKTTQWEDSLIAVRDVMENDLSNSLTDVIMQVDSLSDAFENLLNQIARTIIQRQISDPFASSVTSGFNQVLSGGFSPQGGGAPPSVRGVGPQQGGFGGFLSGIGDFFGGFFANGGNVSGNQAHVVGERGPELFVPRQDGQIVPNHQMGGGGDVTVNIINQGGEQMEAQQQQSRRGPNGEMTVDVMVKSSMERLDSQGQLDGIFRRHGARRQGQF